MSFLNKFKGRGQRSAATSEPGEDLSFDEAYPADDAGVLSLEAAVAQDATTLAGTFDT